MSKKNKKNIFLRIESIGFEGKAIAKHNEKVHFIKKVVPGDLVEAYVSKKRKNYNEAGFVALIEKSERRIDPICDYFDDCGGCSWQNMTYTDQLTWKKQHVIDAFERIGKIKTQVSDVVACDEDFYYRNKMDFTFSAKRWLTRSEIESGDEIDNREFALGLHTPGAFEKVLDIDKCHIHPKTGNEILRKVRDYALRNEITAYDKKDKTGYLRELITRYNGAGNEVMIVLTTNASTDELDRKVDELAKILSDSLSENLNFIHAINSGPSPVAIESKRLVMGREFLMDKILDVDFKISPFSFFQTNRLQLNKFISLIVESANLNEGMNVWDLYCGTGSITLPAASKVRKIHGIELVESAVSDAKENAKLNSIGNATFDVADLHAKDIPDLLSNMATPDLIFIDPPRAGMHTNLVNHLLEIEVPRLIYVSCNPATQARDCSLLAEKYEVKKVIPVDMFPQTYHIESIAILEKKL